MTRVLALTAILLAAAVSSAQAQSFPTKPVTIVLSEKGWVRALKGHLPDLGVLTFKEGDRLRRAFHANTMDKVIVTGSR